ncbi:MAG: InlB B-repeat-containing protein [Clostridia bacterium]|nr:InlB B-repeat-containing protein [Clostridia bacterium]
MSRLRSYIGKGLAVFLAVFLLLTLCLDLFGASLSYDVGTEDPYLVLDGEKVDRITLKEDAKLRLEAVSQQIPSSYRWQIQDPLDENRWINISDSFSQYLWVTNALVGSMLRSNGSTRLRCRMQIGDEEKITDPVTVTLSLNVSDEAASEEETVTKTAMKRSLMQARATEETNRTYTIVINYLFDDNTMAFEPYGASVAEGSDFRETIESPDVVGYSPFRRDGSDYVDATKIEFDLTNIRENVTVNVIYEPALVDYTVYHHLQNLLDDEYTVDYTLTTTGKALTGSFVGDHLALTEEALPGFKPLAYEKLAVAADGSTVIEIRYDRNYYLVDFDMNGGYGTEPVYTRYGAEVGANLPTRHGYVFDGWDLVSYGGEEPSLEQQSIYALETGNTVTVPAANLRYKARWITRETTYTMVFWRENADDPEYSYWGYLDDLSAMSGSTVSGQDWISRVDGISDEQYFTFNGSKTEKDVLVEGDGSTVVNVYYTRNYYKLDFKAPGLCSIEPNHTHTDACYEDICGLEHTHSETCVSRLKCTVPEHPAHTDSCILCGKEEHVHGSVGCDCTKSEHTHTVSCWRYVGSVQSSLNNAPSNPQDGQIYRSGRYYIHIAGRWYRYNGWGASSGDIVDPICGQTAHIHGTDCTCNKDPHTHTDACYRDVLHVHTDACYEYSCGMQAHTHENDCLRLTCPIDENHVHDSTCNNASRTNTVKTVYAKYGQSLKHLWPVKDDNGTLYNSGQRWSPTNSSYYNAVLVYIAQMPPDDFTLTLSTADYKTFTMNYYLQVLPGNPYDEEHNGKYYKLDNTVKANYNYITKAEDFFDIKGFVREDSDPAFGSNGQITTNASALTVNFYYDRVVDHYLEFNNNGTVLSDASVYGIPYEAPLREYENFVPPYPENLEPNAYSFKGWYTSPGCFDGTEVNWSNVTMPEGNLMLYAKWAPITHTVRVFKDFSLSEQIGPTQTVNHKAFATVPEGNVTNGNYIFQGWFYKDSVNGEEVEKAFAFHGIPIRKDMDIYAKWSSHVPVNYSIYYRIENTETDIADPTFGSAIAGQNKTFDAKAGDKLYANYQKGYYPLTNSHTVTMSVNGDHEFIFYYKFVDCMPYKVRYVNSETGEPLCEDKIVEDNGLSVVTETFKRFDKMMPDAYQKRLVLSADVTDADNDGIFDANVITFYYNSDAEHAYYRVVHYIQNISGDTYREYRSEETTGVIGQEYTVNALNLSGFVYDPTKTVVNGTPSPSEEDSVSTVLNADGALIELYYNRQTYPYTVRYVDSSTKEDLVPHKTASGLFGEQIVEYAQNLEGIGYELVSDGAKTHTVSTDEGHNVIEFLYKEKTVALKYQIVGPTGCGSLSQSSENLSAISGKTNGSAPYVNAGFIFLGWYRDESCTQAVPSDWIHTETNRLIPQKTGNVWTATTYYAKFSALETNLTITTRSTATADKDQVFLFRIQGKEGTDTASVDLTVTVIGNGSVTVTKLPTGDYTITELTDWSWRYENETAQRQITLEYNGGSNELIFDNSRKNGKWLDGNDTRDNLF